MRLSKTSGRLLKVFFDKPNQSFYINELVRLTGLYPNGVYQGLKTLEKQKILEGFKKGRLKFYRLNDSYEHLKAIKAILNKKEYQVGVGFNWVKILNRQASYPFTMALCEANVKHLKKIYGISVSSIWVNHITFGVYYPQEELMGLGKAIADLIESNKGFAKKDILLCKRTCDDLVKLSEEIYQLDLPKLTDKELVKWLKKFNQHYLNVFPFVTVPHGIERHFENKIRKEVTDKKALQVLLSPVALTDAERDDALKIASYVKKNGFDAKAESLIDKHRESYCWLSLWSIHAKPLVKDYFKKEIQNILDNVKNPNGELKRLKGEEKLSQKKLEATFKKIKASRALKEQVMFLQEYIHLRVLRKNAICKAHYYHLPMIFEAGKRLGLSKEEVKLLSFGEIIDGLLKKATSKSLKKMADDRQKGWSILMLDGKPRTITGPEKIIETIERYNIVAPTSSMQRMVKGNPACQGKVTGRVKVVNKLSELDKIKKGDVLVTKMTTPDYMMAIHKSAAIVTDEGGITCHAAIVSREFNIPCIMATKNGTQILSDNDLVEVDAYEGTVRVVETVQFPEDLKIIPATTIYKGKVRGQARIVLDAADFSKIKSNDILVSPQTTSEYLSSLYRVKGFIVDEESFTSHAVLCGKALKIPSVMGAKFARFALKDGDRIELDATRGIIKKI